MGTCSNLFSANYLRITRLASFTVVSTLSEALTGGCGDAGVQQHIHEICFAGLNPMDHESTIFIRIGHQQRREFDIGKE